MSAADRLGMASIRVFITDVRTFGVQRKCYSKPQVCDDSTGYEIELIIRQAADIAGLVLGRIHLLSPLMVGPLAQRCLGCTGTVVGVSVTRITIWRIRGRFPIQNEAAPHLHDARPQVLPRL